jgi:hypothetical protein
VSIFKEKRCRKKKERVENKGAGVTKGEMKSIAKEFVFKC